MNFGTFTPELWKTLLETAIKNMYTVYFAVPYTVHKYNQQQYSFTLHDVAQGYHETVGIRKKVKKKRLSSLKLNYLAGGGASVSSSWAFAMTLAITARSSSERWLRSTSVVE